MFSFVQIYVILCLKDNYSYLIRDDEHDITICIDPGEAHPLIQRLEQTGWHLHYIFNTHHHWDHTDGNAELVKSYNPQVFGAAWDANRIPHLTRGLLANETFTVGSLKWRCLKVPGHTTGHIAYHLEDPSVVFTGDALFNFGCGRMFEGNGVEMWSSMKAIRELPNETLVYCGHEYTEANLRFARSLEPHNPFLIDQQKIAQQRRSKSLPTVPSTMALQSQGNPFLRADDPTLLAAIGLAQNNPAETFTYLRNLKDNFKS